jgi:hypothetical protein
MANKLTKNNPQRESFNKKSVIDEYVETRSSPIQSGIKVREGSNHSSRRFGNSSNDYQINVGHLVPAKQQSIDHDKRSKNMTMSAPYSDIGVS